MPSLLYTAPHIILRTHTQVPHTTPAVPLSLEPQLDQPVVQRTLHLKLQPWVNQLNIHGSEEGLPVLQVAAPSLALLPPWQQTWHPKIGHSLTSPVGCCAMPHFPHAISFITSLLLRLNFTRQKWKGLLIEATGVFCPKSDLKG